MEAEAVVNKTFFVSALVFPTHRHQGILTATQVSLATHFIYFFLFHPTPSMIN